MSYMQKSQLIHWFDAKTRPIGTAKVVKNSIEESDLNKQDFREKVFISAFATILWPS